MKGAQALITATAGPESCILRRYPQYPRNHYESYIIYIYIIVCARAPAIHELMYYSRTTSYY